MPDSFDLYGLAKLPESVHALRPLWINPALCNTGEIADSANLGQRIVCTQQHFLHYRYNGLCHWSLIKDADPDGTIYIPVHMPERRDAGNHSLVVFFEGKPDSEAELEWGQGLGSGTPTSFWTGFGDGTTPMVVTAVLDYDAPSGTGANSVDVIEIKHTNFAPRTVCAYHCGMLSVDSTQYVNAPGCAAPGRVIDSTSASYAGMIEAVGDGSDDVESLERLTRRVFLNGTHPDGIHDTGGGVIGYKNLFAQANFAARCRDLDGSNGKRAAYPVFVAKRLPALMPGDESVIKVSSSVAGDSWTYTWQAGDGVGKIFIHPWRTGSSAATGLEVASNGDDEITIEINNDTDYQTYIYAWALFEGPNY